tara:strand:+ start:267 stop:524 length:258 start_codon:yes stop_codon:yes gene_type:complete
MFQKTLSFVICINTITFLLLYSSLNLDIQNKDLERNIYSIFKKEEIETVKLVNVKNSFYYKIILSERINLIKLGRELDIIEKKSN